MIVQLKRLIDRFFSTGAAGLYLILFAAAIGVATFVENDYGTSAAQKVIYQSRWFEMLLILFGITVVVNIFRFRMIQQKKYAILTFHAAIIVILIGAAATRYFGSEGMMHIREGSQSNLILSSDTHLQFEVEQEGEIYQFSEKVFFTSLGKNSFDEGYQIGDRIVDIKLRDFIPNPIEQVQQGSGGNSIIKVVTGGTDGRQENLIEEGEKVSINGILFNFGNETETGAFNISYKKDSLRFITDQPVNCMQMATQELDTLSSATYHPLLLRSLYSVGGANFVLSEFLTDATTVVVSGSQKMNSSSIGLARLLVNVDGQEVQLDLNGSKGRTGKAETVLVGDSKISAAYGSKYLELPFSIRLKDFIMERYPGTNSASSYASEVTLIDPRNNIERDQRIFMNNILNYDGYRFFQSSFDKDEKGTILSVNHDALGTWISYLGYFLLTLGMVLTLLSKRSRFHSLSRKLQDMRQSRKLAGLLLLVFPLAGIVSANTNVEIDPSTVIDEQHAAKFGALIVQDHQGRMKPINTMASEVLRKLSRKTELYDLNAEQIFLGMMVHPVVWGNIPLIKIGRHEDLKAILEVDDKLATYNDFFNPDYILRDLVQRAYNMEPKDRGTLEKEVIKIDERVNICNLIFGSRLLRIFPNASSQSNLWTAPSQGQHMHNQIGSDDFGAQFFPKYRTALMRQDWAQANELADELCQYQKKYGGEIIPSDRKINAEIQLNKMDVFSRVGKWYALSGLLALIMFFTLVFNPSMSERWPLRVMLTLLGICFLAHTLGLGLRWYVSGRAPWSNGYESMIYIAWTTILAGLLFTRKSLGGLAATSVLASTILMVAGLSWLDPEITPLVPVLKSYWLTIHVSLVAGSYGFLMLGAIIGVLNLILMIFTHQGNHQRIQKTIKEMSSISEMTLIGGLFMISIGTYLGGVWANESWGRYWGWDAKETWALVTILVYAFILHMRFIPGFRGLYAFNVATLFGLASVMMTYFGVNYYLSGLHSYAAGDPAPIPPFVFYTVASLFLISLLALWKNKLNSRISQL
ncbi:MAG: cytochrome c biogenesis protein CcsA [Saprospiraceae bacterium]|nr:cytochrome c biogenesis protein CcsA [Saprospiraceae bacterium]